MRTTFVEAHGNGLNWGKFLLARFTDEWEYRTAVPLPPGEAPVGLLLSQGWGADHLLIVDLATGEGAIFSPGGYAHADLDKHAVWVCPLFEPFLEWLWAEVRDGLDPMDCGPVVELPDAPASMTGYRRPGLGRTS